MSESLYTVTEAAKRLKLHVKTVLSFIRDGRLKATRVGKQYRIVQSDLDAFAGQQAPQADVRRHRHVDVSSIVEIDAISRTTAERAVTHLQAALKGRSPEDRPTRLDTIYYEEIARLKLIISASPGTTASLLNLIPILIEER